MKLLPCADRCKEQNKGASNGDFRPVRLAVQRIVPRNITFSALRLTHAKLQNSVNDNDTKKGAESKKLEINNPELASE